MNVPQQLIHSAMLMPQAKILLAPKTVARKLDALPSSRYKISGKPPYNH